MIIEIKVKEEIDKYNKRNKNKKEIINENDIEDYEALLRKEEAEIRKHISTEHQYRLHFETLAEKIGDLENDNYILAKKIVKKNYIIIIYTYRKNKGENMRIK